MARIAVKAQVLEPVRRKRAAMLDHLRSQGVVDASAITRAELVASRTQQPVEHVLNQLGSLSDDDLAEAYAVIAGCEIWSPGEAPPATDLASFGVAEDFLRRAQIVPIRGDDRTIVCAVQDPLDDQALAGLAFASGREVKILAARPADFRRAFDDVFGAAAPQAVETDNQRLDREVDLVKDSAIEGGGARLVNEVFEAAIAAGASDIHFEPRRHDLRIRLRVDGRMIEHLSVASDLSAPTVSRVKVLANLNLGERRLPQDGRTTFVVRGKPVDVRVATSPTVFGEAAVLRILDRSAVPLDIRAMGLSPHIGEMLQRAARSPHGIFLVTGPTGSGKTTTLYALLQTFAGSDRKVLSVEDPVEYHFEHVTQPQVAPNLGLTFAAALRSFLRQDPDVILVGEIRDPETAAVAIQAAMTGHFVLASVHANSALAVVPRLQDMGVEPFQLAASLRGVVAQRLVRRVCQTCHASGPDPGAAQLLRPRFGPRGGHGCPTCSGTGFKGRVPIAEGFHADEAMLRAIAERRPMPDLARLAESAGLGSMLADGLDKVAAGLTLESEVRAAVDV